MKFVDEFRDLKLAGEVSRKIASLMPDKKVDIMEVCGTHTQSFFRFGLHKLLPENLRLIAGPGCPVCVSHQSYIDNAIGYARNRNNIILSFGDMLRVPGSGSTLEKEKAQGADVRVIYSAWDSLKVAKEHPQKKVIFLAVGFETTAPTVALSILEAKKEKLNNLFFFSSLKTIPPAMEYLLRDKRLKLSGFLCPGHVSAIIGSAAYQAIAKRHKIACCVAGFEPLDMLEGIYFLLKQIVGNRPRCANQYARLVKKQGNKHAQKMISAVFQTADALWRGLGKIPASGLRIRDKFARFDAEKQLPVKSVARRPCLSGRQALSVVRNCRCGDVLKGLISPLECPLFYKACRPQNPVGPCMVSSEGACNAYYKYH